MIESATRVMTELEAWRPRFERGELRPPGAGGPSLAPNERFAVDVGRVRAAGLGHPTAGGVLHATDRRALVLGSGRGPVREWELAELAAVSALGNWGGLALVHAGGDTELVVAVGPELPTWRDAAGWLKVEAAFAAARGQLSRWLADLPQRLTLGEPAWAPGAGRSAGPPTRHTVTMSVLAVPVVPRPARAAVDAARRELSDLLSADRVHTGADALAQHGHDESFHPEARPDMVVWPRTVDEAAAIVRVAAAHRLPLVPFGAGTSLEGHVAALAGGLSVDMRDMDAIGRPSIEDLDVVVQAGVTRRALDARLRPEGVFFSVDPGADATVGGMIATGASGTTTVRYGAMRENVVSITFVNARGEVVRTHSRARKSSAGYDLTRLMIGSEGTLGLICEATLRLHPIPEATAAAQCTFPTVEAAVQCVVRVGQHAIPVARIELADELQIEAINRHDQTSFTVAPTLFIEFHGTSREDVAAQARDTAEIAAEYGGSDFAWASDEGERRQLWRARHRAMEATRAMRPGSGALTTDVCVPVSALADCITATQADIAEHELTASIVGHVGDGNFHVIVLVDPANPAEVADGEEFHARLVRRALAVDGTCTGEHGVGYGKTRFLAEEHGRPAVEMMRAVKRALDPDGIFNPGKTASAAG